MESFLITIVNPAAKTAPIIPTKPEIKIDEFVNSKHNNKPKNPIKVTSIFWKVIFSDKNDEIRLIHIANNRSIFAKGAIETGKWIIHQSPGLYSYSDYDNEKNSINFTLKTHTFEWSD